MGKQNISDDDIQQATCAVLNDKGEPVGTAWLVSSEGHLLTAGHLLGTAEPKKEIYVQFLGEAPCLANRVSWGYQKEMGIDYAVLKLDFQSEQYRFLPIQLIESASSNLGEFRLYGFGISLKYMCACKGHFIGNYERLNCHRVFRFRSEDADERGYSGSAIFSDKLQAVVALQIQAIPAEGTVFGMPLYRIADLWKPLQDISEGNAVKLNPQKRGLYIIQLGNVIKTKNYENAVYRMAFAIICNLAGEKKAEEVRPIFTPYLENSYSREVNKKERILNDFFGQHYKVHNLIQEVCNNHNGIFICISELNVITKHRGWFKRFQEDFILFFTDRFRINFCFDSSYFIHYDDKEHFQNRMR